MENENFEVYTNRRLKWKNRSIIKKFFPLETVLEITHISSHCDQVYEEIEKENPDAKFYATLSYDGAYVAILYKTRKDKHQYRFIETMRIERFSCLFEIIDK